MPATRLNAGQIVDDFALQLGEHVTIVDQLFADSFGRVYEVLDARMDSDRPIRRVLRVVNSDEDGAAPLWCEPYWERVHLLAKQTWPNLCTLRDAGQLSPGTPYYMFDACGPRLSDSLAGHKGVNRNAATLIVENLLIALEGLHLQGLAHGDVRPEQIAVAKDRDRTLALFAEPAIGPLTWWSRGGLLDNRAVAYFPPEWSGRAAEPSPQVDLYALGLVASELILGREALSGDKKLLPKRLRKGKASAAYCRFVKRLLAESPSRRPADATAALQEWRSLHERARAFPLGLLTVVLTIFAAVLLLWGVHARGRAMQELARADGQVQELQSALDAERAKAITELHQKLDLIASDIRLTAPDPGQPPNPPKPDASPTSEELAKQLWTKAWDESKSSRGEEVLQTLKARLASDDVLPEVREFASRWWTDCRGLSMEAKELELDGVFAARYRSCFQAPWRESPAELSQAIRVAVGVWTEWMHSNRTWNEVGIEKGGTNLHPDARLLLDQWYQAVNNRSGKSWTVRMEKATAKSSWYRERILYVYVAERQYYGPQHRWTSPKEHTYTASQNESRVSVKSWKPGEPVDLQLFGDWTRLSGWTYREDLTKRVRYGGPLAIVRLHHSEMIGGKGHEATLWLQVENCPGPSREVVERVRNSNSTTLTSN